MGDSRTSNGIWTQSLQTALASATGNVWQVQNAGVGGATVASARAAITTTLATYPDVTEWVLCNWGANDWSGGLPAEATWEADYEAILDAIHAKWPTVPVYIMRPWDRGHDADAAIVSGWITTIQAARSSFVTIGPDEAVWLKGADNGATMTVDGVHYSAAGNTEVVNQWRTVMGY